MYASNPDGPSLPCPSLAVSVKMNILLFAPALLLAYLRCLGLWGTVKQLTICAAVQVTLRKPASCHLSPIMCFENIK